MNAALLRRKNHATAAARPAISHAIVTTLAEAPRAAWVADTLAAEEVVKNAINAGKWVISPATVLKAVREAMVEEAVAMVVEAMEVGTEADALSKLAIPVAATDTCLVTAPKARSVTTVSHRSFPQSPSSSLMPCRR